MEINKRYIYGLYLDTVTKLVNARIAIPDVELVYILHFLGFPDTEFHPEVQDAEQ